MNATAQTETSPYSLRGHWYDDGGTYVVVVTGMPDQSVRIGVGGSPAAAWESLRATPIGSTGPDGGLGSALAWGPAAGWCSDPDDLEELSDDDVAGFIPEPVGDVEWTGDAEGYVSCRYGADGDQPGDFYVRVGEDAVGCWWIDDGDDDVRQIERGPFPTEDVAREAAVKLAEEQDEAEDGEDAEAMVTRLLEERAGEPDPEGAWCVYWETCGDDVQVVERYPSEEAAEAAAALRQPGLESDHPGGRLLCGYGVRALVDGEWVIRD